MSSPHNGTTATAQDARLPDGADAPITLSARIGGEWRDGDEVVEIRDPYRGSVVGLMPISTDRDLDDAVRAARSGHEAMAAMPPYERATLLRRAGAEVKTRSETIGRVMAAESGKALGDCIGEVSRVSDLLELCAEEAVRIQGEQVPMDFSAVGAGKLAVVMRFPVGVVAGITPFNAPVNMAAQKVGPALAAGNSIILKPSPKAPISAHLFVEALVDAGVPAGAVNTLYGDSVSPGLVGHAGVDCVSFTGSIPVGKRIAGAVGLKRIALELGGVGPTFVSDDADLELAADGCGRNAMLLAGQSCVSVQNVFVKRSVYGEFVERVRAVVGELKFGDPIDATTDVGTLIDEDSARRVEAVVERAASAGATVLCGGGRSGAQMQGTILTGVTADMDAVAAEIFGPVMTVQPYDDEEPLFQAISDSPYGLQCGIFTNSLDLALKAFRTVRTGGVIVNATSRWRSDQMPYGGVKESGIGREGPKYSIREMTDERLLVFN
jgi:acyl-CoA reductase-like NAD-dependent aldehyde dehydrogenase